MPFVVMKLQAIYDRLQRDVLSIYGENPQLSASRAPLYEGLWKRLLTAIEEIGTDSASTSVQLTTESAGKCESSTGESKETPVRQTCSAFTCRLLLSIFRSDGRCEALVLDEIPNELVDLARKALETTDRLTAARYLQCLRQVCLFTYKCKSHEVTTTQRESAVTGFRARNSRCRDLSKSFYQHLAGSKEEVGQVLRIARLLISVVVDPVDWRDIKPAHGPGAVADAKRKGASKWRQIDGACCRVTDKMYPISDYFTPSPSMYDYTRARFVDPVCKLSIVPKDRRGPRVICTQPSGLMWIQQGQRRNLERCIENSRHLKVNRHVLGGPDCSIKFDKQENNGSLALESSRTREFATIDLKDASDLVSWGLVRYLFNEETSRFLAASRATHVIIKKDAVERLHMYAPMGSAMCFPIESIVFWGIATAATLVCRGVTYDRLCRMDSPRKWLSQNLSEVFVFGDDILVRSEMCQEVCERLKEVGFIPNLGKTFSKGFYREACGVDAFYGVKLDIARLQNLTLTSMSDAYALIDLAKRSRALGMICLTEYIEHEVEAFLGFRLAAGITGGALWTRGWTYDESGARNALEWNLRRGTSIRFNTRYQYFEGKTVIASPLEFHEPEDGRCRLFRGLTTGVYSNAAVGEHTVDWLNPDNSQYHLGWVRAF